MKNLKDILLEASILGDIEDTLEQDGYDIVVNKIKYFLTNNYKSFKYTISKKPNKDGKYIVNSSGKVEFTGNSNKLTNDFFVFGKCKKFYIVSNQTLEDLEGAPEEVQDFYVMWSLFKTCKGGPKIITGDCVMSRCRQLESLEGMPESIGGELNISWCSNLKTLIGAPKNIGKDFNAIGCGLENIEGAPRYVEGTFNISSCNNLKSLEGSPDNVRFFIVRNSESLKTLKGATENIRESFSCSESSIESLDVPNMTVGRHFTCENCKNLKSFKDAPKVIKEDLHAEGCILIKSLEGLPTEIGRNMIISNCQIESLSGCPKTIGNKIDISGNIPSWSVEDFEKLGIKFKRFIGDEKHN